MYIECRHIFPSGKKCKSPALTEKDFCYFHHNKRNQKRVPQVREANLGSQPSTLVHYLPQLEDGDTILTAISDVIQALAANRIDPRRAQILIYGLQVASQHSKRLSPHTTLEPVREAYQDEDGSLVGPRLQAYDTEDISLDDEAEDEDDEVTEEERRAYFNRPWETVPQIQAVAQQTSTEPRKAGKRRCRITAHVSVPTGARERVAELSAVGNSQRKKAAVFFATENGGLQEPEKKHRKAFLQSGEAPLLPPDPPLPIAQLRAYAQKQILKTFYLDGAVTHRIKDQPGRRTSEQGTAKPFRNRASKSNRKEAEGFFDSAITI